MTAGKTVWILGAGFSYSLGGPLLDDVFSRSLLRRVTPRLPGLIDVLDERALSRLHSLFGKYDDPTGRWLASAGGRPWRDAEEFLAALDAAADDRNSHWAGVLSRSTPIEPALGDLDAGALLKLRDAARTYLVAATDYFVPQDRRTALEQEAWQPYKRWGERVLASGSHVVNFNYDRVVEHAVGPELTVLLPHVDLRKAKRPWLLKLHGSVTWLQPKDSPNINDERECSGTMLLENGHHPLVALPGPTKYASTSPNGPLASLWGAAEEVLRSASRVIVVGYRFPPGDPAARHRLLGALAANCENELDVHIVLGADTAHRDVKRLEGLLSWTLRAREGGSRSTRVRVEPLFAEDFIDMFDAEAM